VADILDVCTLEDVKAALGLQDGSSDAELAGYITAVSRMLDEKCGPIVHRTITSEENPTVGDGLVGLQFYPVVSVSSLVEYNGATSTMLTQQTPGTAPANGFKLNKRTGNVRRYSGGYRFQFPCDGSLVATYVAGRYATTATVDERFARAAILTIVEQWRANKGMGTVTFGVAADGTTSGSTGIPRDAWVLIKDDLRVSWLP